MGANDLFGIPRRQDPPRSEIKCFSSGTPAYNGSTNIYTRCFNKPAVISTGSDITYVSDTVFGDRFIINTPGVYSITYMDYSAGGAQNYALTLNEPLSQNIAPFSIPGAQILQNGVAAASNTASLSATEFFYAGDVIRAKYGQSAASNASDGSVQFRIIKVSS